MGLRIFLQSSGVMLLLLLWGTHSYGIEPPPHRNHAGNDLTDELKLIQLSHFIDKDTEVSLPI